MDGAKIGYIPFTSQVWKKVSPEALSFVKKLTQAETSFNNFEILVNDPWITNLTRKDANTVPLSIDNLYKIKKVLLQQNFEKLVHRIR